MSMGMFEFFKAKKAATSIEYAVIASLLSIVILAALLLISSANNDNYTGVATKVGDAMK